MKYNKEFTQEEIIKELQNKYLFIGFIVGIAPFVLLISLIALKEGGIEFIPTILRNILLLSGTLTAIINSIALRQIITNKIKTSYF